MELENMPLNIEVHFHRQQMSAAKSCDLSKGLAAHGYERMYHFNFVWDLWTLGRSSQDTTTESALENPARVKFQCYKFIIGIFSTTKNKSHEDTRRKWMTMHTVGSPLKCGLNFVFVHGRGGPKYKDTIKLDIQENMNEGKSFQWFKEALTLFKDASYIFKMDMDTGHCSKTLEELLNQAASKNSDYIGWKHDFFTCGKYAYCPPVKGNWAYMSGAFYGLSRKAIAKLNAYAGSISGFEDLKIGKSLYTVMKPRVFDIECLYKRDPQKKYHMLMPMTNVDNCPIRHFQQDKDKAKEGSICTPSVKHS
jgi:hypothetical protein